MTVSISKTPVNNYDIVSNIPLSVEVYQISLASVNLWEFLRPTTQPKPTRLAPILWVCRRKSYAYTQG